MPYTDPEDSFGKSIPLSAVLAAMIGFGMLLSYFKFIQLSRDWTDTGRLLFVVSAAVLLLWGVKNLLTGSSPTTRKQRIGLSRHRAMFTRQSAVYLAIMAVALVGSLIGHVNMLMLVFALMAGPYVINGSVVYCMLKRTNIRRRVPKHAMAGEPVSIEIILENHKHLMSSWLMSVRDRISNQNERLEAGVLFFRVPSRDQRIAHYQIQLMQRGKYTLGPIYLSSRFPLGLAERGLMFYETDEILIFPRLGKLSSSWKRDHLIAPEVVSHREPMRGTFDDEFHRIREYRAGDNPRAIHWRTSARHNELMVREFHQSRSLNLVVLLDLWVSRQSSEDELDRVELAVSLTATICVEHMRQSRDATLYLSVAGTTLSSWEGRSGPTNIESLLEVLALLQPGFVPDVEKLVDTSAAKRPVGTQTLLITTRQGAQLDDVLSRRNGADASSEIQVLETNHGKLSEFFQLDESLDE